MLKLRLENENHEMNGVEFKIGEATVLIGREDTDILLEDVDMSATHAAVWIDKKTGKLVVRDLCSANGTRVNQTDLKPHQNVLAEEGYTIKMGSTVFRVVS